MNYEYKDEILEHIGPEPNCNYQSERDEHYAMLKELNEVYRKAKVFDDIEERFDSYKTGVKKDYEKDMTGTNLHLLLVGAAVKNHFDDFYVESEDE